MKSKIKMLWNILTWALVLIIVLGAIALVGVRVVGLTPYAVLSGSMEPTYHTGSLLYVKKVDPTALQSGDVITFKIDEKTIATHRIVEVVSDAQKPDALSFRTKGDANDSVDGSLVFYKNVIGTPVTSIPKLGYLSYELSQPKGRYLAMAIFALLLAMLVIPNLFGGDEKPIKKQE